MKKIAMAALALTAATGIALAEVTSANTVGYTTKAVSADTFYLCGIQFEEVGGDGAINLNDLITMSGIEAGEFDTMESAAPQIQVLNASGSGYNMFYYISDALDGNDEVEGWADGNGDLADGAINIGKGFWFKAPTASVKGTPSIQLKGQVSGDTTGSVSFTANTFALASNPYPVATDLTKATMTGVTAGVFDTMETNAPQIQALNAAATGYNMFYYISDALDGNDEVEGWADGNGDLAVGGAIPVGDGFWIKAPSAGSITFSL